MVRVTPLAGAFFAASVFFVPTMVVIMGIVERTTPENRLTEAMTWMIAGLQSGVAVGAAVTGVVYDRFGAAAGFSVGIGAGAGALLLALGGLPMLRGRQAGTSGAPAGAPEAGLTPSAGPRS
ncbi:hypothetical protein IPZ68_14570 [Streptomyces arenae]|nr:hypothetical protein [Streptomyces arenae]